MTVETVLFLGVSLLALGGIALGMPEPGLHIQAVALALGVALIGLPHGALDPLLAWRAGMLGDWRATLLFHAAYVFAAALMLSFWFMAPVLALLLFLSYSAHHFAGDWTGRPALARFALGVSLLSLPAFAHAVAVADIYALLSGEPVRQIAVIQHQLAPLWLGILGIAMVMFLRRGKAAFALELLAAVATGIMLPPLLFFLVYFCALHSPRHFLAIWRASANRRQATAGVAAYTALTLIIAIPAALWFGGSGNMANAMQQVVFIGLAALTVPHMILSSILEKPGHV